MWRQLGPRGCPKLWRCLLYIRSAILMPSLFVWWEYLVCQRFDLHSCLRHYVWRQFVTTLTIYQRTVQRRTQSDWYNADIVRTLETYQLNRLLLPRPLSLSLMDNRSLMAFGEVILRPTRIAESKGASWCMSVMVFANKSRRQRLTSWRRGQKEAGALKGLRRQWADDCLAQSNKAAGTVQCQNIGTRW